jgi:hypothetical protein
MQYAIRIGDEGDGMRAAACNRFGWPGKAGSDWKSHRPQYANGHDNDTMAP